MPWAVLSVSVTPAWPVGTPGSHRAAAAVRKARYPDALHVCVGDGAQGNWEFFATPYPEAVWVLDFYHAATHLHAAAEAIFGQGPEAEEYYERWRITLRDEEDGVVSLLRSFLYYRNRARLSASAQRVLDTELNYFRQHTELMQYADFRAAGLPIGSGVTEAGCKELVKARFCRSGMRWKRTSGAPNSHRQRTRPRGLDSLSLCAAHGRGTFCRSAPPTCLAAQQSVSHRK
jgi:hypothetical protein